MLCLFEKKNNRFKNEKFPYKFKKNYKKILQKLSKLKIS